MLMDFDENTMIFMLIISFSIIFIVIISILFRNKEIQKRKDKLVKKNKYLTNNKQYIKARLNIASKELDNLKVNLIMSFVLVLISIGLIFLVEQKIIIILFLVFLLFALGFNYIKYCSLNDTMYDEMATNALHDYNKDLLYYPYNGFSEYEYKMCLFPETCDRFTSEDLIVNPYEFFYYSDIIVESEHEDNDDNTYYVTEFKGSLARMSIKDINCEIYLGGTNSRLLYRDKDYTSIKFENDEFNKKFRACSSDELLAYKVLTPDVMEEFVKIKKNTFGDIDIRIIHDRLYVRFLSGDSFDSILFNKKTEKKELIRSIAVLEEVMKTMEKIKNIIDEKNME